ncbi:hypothetical protein N7470_010031 [Penicillium chermesinum]|nr:hypothetical protein N7470_010031 [Penicillium chermesinum]
MANIDETFISTEGDIVTRLSSIKKIATHPAGDTSAGQTQETIYSTVSYSVEENSPRQSPSGINPEAPAFTPASHSVPTAQKAEIVKGIRTPKEFLDSLKMMEINKKINAAGEKRRVVLKNLPENAKLTDVFCLVFGGQIDRVTMNGREANVDFLTAASAQNYYDKVSRGIRVDGHLITVEQGVSPKLTSHILSCVDSGTTRVVHAIVPPHMTVTELYDSAKELNLERLEYRLEPTAAKEARAWFFFCGITDGYDMMRKLIIEPEWNTCPCSPNFMPDPCTADWFHGDGMVSSPMAKATVVEAQAEADSDMAAGGAAGNAAEPEADADAADNGFEIYV